MKAMLGLSFGFVACAQIWEGRIKGALANEAPFRKFLREVVIVPLKKRTPIPFFKIALIAYPRKLNTGKIRGKLSATPALSDPEKRQLAVDTSPVFHYRSAKQPSSSSHVSDTYPC
jgi:hypothetical protein